MPASTLLKQVPASPRKRSELTTTGDLLKRSDLGLDTKKLATPRDAWEAQVKNSTVDGLRCVDEMCRSQMESVAVRQYSIHGI